MRRMLHSLLWVVRGQFGIDVLRIIRVLTRVPTYIKDLFKFKRNYHGRLELLPCLTDWNEEGGTAIGEYFWQDLYVARKIHDANPLKHVDIGSRVDGFVAHVASFRELEVLDIRPISADVPGVVFKQADLMRLDQVFVDYCDSASCLHALEHFGLGRYGDPINPYGHEAGLQNMAKILSPGGMYYLSVPIGLERVEFNGHRVFDPKTIIQLAGVSKLVLKSFAYVGSSGQLLESISPAIDFEQLARERYALGIFTFEKMK